MHHYGQITQLHDQAVAFVHDLERHRSHPVNLDALEIEGDLTIGDLVIFALDDRMRNVRSIERIERLPDHLLPFCRTCR